MQVRSKPDAIMQWKNKRIESDVEGNSPAAAALRWDLVIDENQRL